MKELWKKEKGSWELTPATENLIACRICYSSGCTSRKADIRGLII